MSFHAVRWALSVQAPSSAAKLLLIAMADLIREPDFKAWGAAESLAKVTQLDRKTVLANLARLEAVGLITRLEERRGRGGAPVFKLAWSSGQGQESGTDSGTGSDPSAAAEPIPLFSRTDPAFPANRYRNSREVVPEAGHKPVGTSVEPVLNHKRGAHKGATAHPVSRPEDVSEEVWVDWHTLRKAKKAPVTETVVKGARQEAAKADMSLEAFLRIWCARGSQGLQAEWLKPQERAAARRTAGTFADVDYTAGLPR